MIASKIGYLALGALLACGAMPANAAFIQLATSVYRDAGQVDGVVEFERRLFNSNGRTEYYVNGGSAIITETRTGAELLALGEHGTSFAYVDLSRGKIGGLAESRKPDCRDCSYAGAFAYASFQEDLVFRVAGAQQNELTPISFVINVHGKSTPRTGSGNDVPVGTADLIGQFGFGQFNISADQARFTQRSGFARSYVTGGGDIHSYSFIYNLRGPVDFAPFRLNLSLASTNNAFSDYANTASIRFDLPENVTFTSSSGVFLSDTSAVPEPGALALLALGVVGVAVTRRQRRGLP
jgi:hypothetical protein